MEKIMKFKTNISCKGCKSTVKPFLESFKDKISWEIDLDSEDKLLTVTTSEISSDKIVKKIDEAGYEALEISSLKIV